ncbi:uncharacterized protein [Henckelia pumila]|uniref:uncharacterized protein n=1 Tax=Henckelia pumila TaxID=405737 RepID=UPI003C6E81E8
MAGYDNECSHCSVCRWGDEEELWNPQALRHRQDNDRRWFDLNKFIRLRTKPLVGSENPNSAEDWLECMERCFWSFHCLEEQKMEATEFLLENMASKWWNSASAFMMAQQGCVTWADFRKAFSDLNFPPALRQEREVELLSLNQGEMTIDEYQQKFIDLLPFCPHVSESSATKLDQFMLGLNQDIYERVAVFDNPSTYESLVNRCMQDEDRALR